jgi:hypothetical protein
MRRSGACWCLGVLVSRVWAGRLACCERLSVPQGCKQLAVQLVQGICGKPKKQWLCAVEEFAGQCSCGWDAWQPLLHVQG